ncbi:hypothetical protein XELAEV_18016613mg [Xenopus laevis]|uniref:Secreted protein n=1 Tax=Xenopus laevis TaxID=8355 RepID=A0A974D9H5_XENLA|nr:hypothetical protein XELAEV_18016613mg [Xenopus laevis]
MGKRPFMFLLCLSLGLCVCWVWPPKYNLHKWNNFCHFVSLEKTNKWVWFSAVTEKYAQMSLNPPDTGVQRTPKTTAGALRGQSFYFCFLSFL